MTRAQVFPCILIVLNCCAASMYALDSNWNRTVYWLAAAVLTACVTF